MGHFDFKGTLAGELAKETVEGVAMGQEENLGSMSYAQQSDSVIHIHESILFQILFPVMLLQNIEHYSLCCTGGPC